MALQSTQVALIPRFLLPAWTGTVAGPPQAGNKTLTAPAWSNGSRRASSRCLPGSSSRFHSSAHIQLYSAVALQRSSFSSWQHLQQSTSTYPPQHPHKRSHTPEAPNPTQRRSFHATSTQLRDHYFDTLKVVQRLKEEGFSDEQAEAMMRVLSDVIEESIQNLTRTMVLREDQDRATYTQKVDFAKLRSDLLSADSTESAVTRASHERLSNELAKLNSRLRDEIARTQASVRLDLNLEKGRIREEAKCAGTEDQGDQC